MTIALVALATVCPGVITWLYFHVIPGATATLVLYLLNKIGELLVPAVWVCWVLGESFRSVVTSRRGIGTGTIFAVAVVAATLTLYFAYLKHSPCFQGVPAAIHAKLGDFKADTPLGYLLFGSFIALANSAIEEYYWRWFVFGRMRELMNWRPAMVLSSVGFLFHHAAVLGKFFSPEYFWTAALPLAVCVSAGGAVWAWLYHRSGSLLGPWVSHLIVDIAVIVIGADLLRSAW